MALVISLLGFSLLLGLTVKRVGLEVYVALFTVTSVASLAFLYLYFRLFL
jgi:ABC-type uncharacterized transport system permease subunit